MRSTISTTRNSRRQPHFTMGDSSACWARLKSLFFQSHHKMRSYQKRNGIVERTLYTILFE